MKTIYKPKGKAGEYARYACNFYTGCSNDCDYCYCKRGVMAHVWDNKPHLRKCFCNEAKAVTDFDCDIMRHADELRAGGGVFFSFTTDPCLPETLDATMMAVAFALAYGEGVPCTILTKCVSDRFEECLRLLCDNSLGEKIAVGYTLTGHDEMERNASPNEERIAALKRIHDMGIKTFASIEPIIDFPHAMYLMRRTFGFCDLYKVGLRSGVKKSYYKDNDLIDFYFWLEGLLGGYKVYLKDSFLERLPYLYRPQAGHKVFVNADYNIFNS